MIILDSSFLVAYHNTADVHHAAAAGVMQRLIDGEWGAGLLLEYVFLEVTTVLRYRLAHSAANRVGDILLNANELELVPCSGVFLEAYDTFRSVETSALSFVDAAIVAVARRHPPGAVATFDSDFQGLEGVTPVP